MIVDTILSPGSWTLLCLQGMRRLNHLGCNRAVSTANEEPADVLYRSLLQEVKVTDTWIKDWS